MLEPVTADVGACYDRLVVERATTAGLPRDESELAARLVAQRIGLLDAGMVEPLRALRRRLAKGDMPPADEPERPSRDESRAAVAGGTTSYFDMPNNKPAIKTPYFGASDAIKRTPVMVFSVRTRPGCNQHDVCWPDNNDPSRGNNRSASRACTGCWIKRRRCQPEYSAGNAIVHLRSWPVAPVYPNQNG